ncbi:MAG: BTAD domain-containing putative transcriptional regulator [Dissulfuribacterales bacterium]
MADLFWPDYPEDKAQSNLSNALWNLRAVIGDKKENTEFIIVKKSMLQFNPQADYRLDVKTFHDLIDKSRKLKSPEHKSTLSDLEESLSLSRGRFMEGFTIDSPGFETWLVKTRQEIHRKRSQALRWISIHHMQSGNFSTALDYTRDWTAEEPWDERACRLAMQILEKLGQRKKALDEFERCRKRLAIDLGIAPQQETQQLYQQLISNQSLLNRLKTKPLPANEKIKGDIDPGPLPKNLVNAAKRQYGSRPFFGRQEELNQLDDWLDNTIRKEGKAAFIIGEPGSGKTYLLTKFAQQALQKYPDLLLLWGQCNAYTGQGDPYFPFMTMAKMLVGDVEGLILGPIISKEHLRRLWRHLPAMLNALTNFGPDLVKQFFSDIRQFAVAKKHPGVTQELLDSLTALIKSSPKRQGKKVALNDQFCRVLSALSKDHPILLVLDDLQWIDEGSASLLFHLGRQLMGKKILLLGAFRPSEVSINNYDKHHPLIGIHQELKAIYGENLVNLAESKGHSFIEDLLASEANAFTTDFHQKLYRRTSGHPLFTIELLRGMQLRNEIIKDKQGKWVESDYLNWEELPARVEAVIARRFGLLPTECKSLMKLACVQGEAFNVEILARVFAKPEQEVFDLLNEEASKRHQLITPQGIQKVGTQQVTYFRFRHALFQIYQYGQLNTIERKRLHGLIGNEIENLYVNHLPQHPEMAHTLAWHFENADFIEKAIQYYLKAGKHAVRLSAHQDAIRHFEHALELITKIPESSKRDELELNVQLSLGQPLTALKGWGAPELKKTYDRVQKLCENIEDAATLIPALLLLAIFRLGRSEHIELDRLNTRLVALARDINDPALLAMAYLRVSPLYQGRLKEARRLLKRAAVVDDIKLQRHIAHRFGMAPAAVALSYLGDAGENHVGVY